MIQGEKAMDGRGEGRERWVLEVRGELKAPEGLKWKSRQDAEGYIAEVYEPGSTAEPKPVRMVEAPTVGTPAPSPAGFQEAWREIRDRDHGSARDMALEVWKAALAAPAGPPQGVEALLTNKEAIIRLLVRVCAYIESKEDIRGFSDMTPGKDLFGVILAHINSLRASLVPRADTNEKGGADAD